MDLRHSRCVSLSELFMSVQVLKTTRPFLITPDGSYGSHREQIVSVDPPGCTDIDDALHAHRLPNGKSDGVSGHQPRLHLIDYGILRRQLRSRRSYRRCVSLHSARYTA